MPMYQYRCKACGYEFEELQSISAEPLKTCPKCGKAKLYRVISGAGLIFRGSGFYITDYKNKGKSASTSETKKTTDSSHKSHPSR
ncbi:MAG: FmdB family zinc ribbon protein [Bacteroidota bacterium]